jgi:hypothetical protein
VGDQSWRRRQTHQVFKFNPQGKVLMTIGKPGIAGDGPDTFNAPTDVFVAANGDVFVSDGHGGDTNARVVKYSKDASLSPHGASAAAARGACLAACAGDGFGRPAVRRRPRQQSHRNLRSEWQVHRRVETVGRPSGLFIDKNDILYCMDSESTAVTNRGFRRGLTIGSARDGTVTTFIPAPFVEGQAADARHGTNP